MTYAQVFNAQLHPQCQIYHGRDSAKYKNTNAKLVTPWKIGIKILLNVSPVTKSRDTVQRQNSKIQTTSHLDILPLQNRFEVLADVLDNDHELNALGDRITNACTSRGYTYKWEETQVPDLHKNPLTTGS